MAVMRFRRRVFLLLLALSFVSMIFLLSLLPQKDDMVFPGQFKRFYFTSKPKVSESVTRKYAANTSKAQHQEVAPVNNVLAAPQLQPLDNTSDQHKNLTVAESKNDSKAEDSKQAKADDERKAIAEDNKKANADDNKKAIADAKKNTIAANNNKMENNDKKVVEKGADTQNTAKNKTLKEAASGLRAQKNKTVEAGERVKNRTLEHMVVIGVDGSKPKGSPQLVYVPRRWNLSVSFEDIGAVMKDTRFLNKVDPLNLDGPILVSSRNRTANFTYNMPLKFGYCDCFERYCVCCTVLTNKRLHLNSTACSNFTFVSKSHELDLKFFLDGKLIHKALISAYKSPMLCLGSEPKVADVCVHFFNMTFRVNEHNAAQTQLLGCTDLSLNLYNRTLGAFPVDCFQIPADPNKVHKERNFNLVFNWVP